MNDEPQVGAELRTALAELRRPFAAEALKWKVQVNPKTDTGRAMLVCFIDARLAAERLNHVVPGLWSDDYAEVPGGLMCALTVDGVTRRDVGWSSNTSSDLGLKTLYSDAFKRAAVKFGVGVSIYALPKAFLPAAKLERRGSAQKVTWVIPDASMDLLRKSYGRWLEETGKAAFGEPLGHGDAPDAQGDVEADEAPAAEPSAQSIPLPADGPRVQELIKRAKTLHDEIRAVNAQASLPAAFGRALTAAYGDEATLEQFVADLEHRRDELKEASAA